MTKPKAIKELRIYERWLKTEPGNEYSILLNICHILMKLLNDDEITKKIDKISKKYLEDLNDTR